MLCGALNRTLLKDDSVLYVPEVIWDLTTPQVLTTELVRGESLDKLEHSDQRTRDFVCVSLSSVALKFLSNSIIKRENSHTSGYFFQYYFYLFRLRN